MVASIAPVLEHVRHAWQVPSVRRGFWGSALIALGTTSAAYLPRSTPIWRALDHIHATGMPFRIAGTLVTFAGLLLLVDAWFRLRPRTKLVGEYDAYLDVRHWAILLIWALPFLFSPPVFSHDAYSYAAQGWLIVNGINPYEAGPAVLPGSFADQVSWIWRNTPAPYGPLSLQIQALLVIVSGYNPYLAAILQRIPALVGVALISYFVPRVCRQVKADPAFGAWFVVLNPLLLIDYVGGCHNDSLMVGLIVLAVWVAGLTNTDSGGRLGNLGAKIQPYWWLVAAVIVGLGTAIKQPALLTAYALPLIARPWKNMKPREVVVVTIRALASFGVAIASFVLISWASGLGFGWLNAVNVPGQVVTVAPFSLIGHGIQALINLTAIDPGGRAAIVIAKQVGVVVAGLVVSYLAVTMARRRPHAFLAWSYLTVAACLPALRSWYLLWGGAAIPWAKPQPKVVNYACATTLVLLCYDGINMAWRNDSIALGVALGGGVYWLARNYLWRRAQNRKVDK